MRRVLVANRGEIARRVFATCRRLGISTAAVYSKPDANAPFVREADVAVSLGGSAPAESYLRQSAIVSAALACGADAIHPGYGFLSENADFAEAVVAAGLVWVGPSPPAIRAMGSKTEARRLMENAGVPVLPASDDVTDAGAVGFPLLVKASAGGGGKGMRLVKAAGDLEDAVTAAKREAEAAFGDATVFLERYAAGSRHVEVQIVGDAHGTVAALHERDCSVQRRHQKIIEEAPSPRVDPPLRARLTEAAVAAGRALAYQGAGTVEFLLTPDDEFFFLEVNTRLQVEHPVTELITGLDLVELQLAIAQGNELPAAALDPPLRGWAIEARLYAEDVANDFLPVAGTIERFQVPANVRVDTGVEDGSEVSPFYDPMIAKVIAHGATRAEAVRKLADALARSSIQGTTTNRDFLVRVLRDPEFAAGDADTSFLERADLDELARPLLGEPLTRIAALAAALAGQAARRGAAPLLGSLPSGWRNNPGPPQRVSYKTPWHDSLEVEYQFDRAGRLAVPADVDLHRVDASRVELTVEGVRRSFYVSEAAVRTAEGEVAIIEQPRFSDPESAARSGALISPMPGAVVRIAVQQGDTVEEGQVLMIVEAMKMEHEIVAPSTGQLTELSVAVGDQVESGALLATLSDDD